MPYVVGRLSDHVVTSTSPMADVLDSFELFFVGKYVSQIFLWVFIPALIQILLFNVVVPKIVRPKYLQSIGVVWGLYLIGTFVYYVTNRRLSDPNYSLWNDTNYDLIPSLLFVDHVFVIIIAMVQIYLQSDDFGIENRWIYIILTFFLIGYPLWLYRLLEVEEENVTSATDTTKLNNTSTPANPPTLRKSNNSKKQQSQNPPPQSNTTSGSTIQDDKKSGKLTQKSVLLWIYLGLIAFFMWYPASLEFYNKWDNFNVARWGFPISKSPAVVFFDTTIKWAWLVINIWFLPNKWGVMDKSWFHLILNFLLLWFFVALTLTHVATSICVFLAFQQGLVNASIKGPITVRNLLSAMKAGLPTEIDLQKKNN